MKLTLLAALWRAETLKLLSRFPARLGLVIAAALAVAAPALLWWMGSSEMIVNGTPMADSLSLDAATGTLWALKVRNFYVLRVFILVLAALSFAGELKARTLREDLLRPVPRAAVLFAKWSALCTWIAATVLISWVVSSGVGAVLLGLDGAWGPSVQAHLATVAADVGFAALALAVAVFARSVAGTIAGVFLFLVLDTMLGWFLWFAGMMRDSMPPEMMELPVALNWLLDATPWLPSSAFAVWFELANAADPSWQAWVSLAAITTLSMVLAERRFARMDVP